MADRRDSSSEAVSPKASTEPRYGIASDSTAASKRCMWAFATRRRCKSSDTAPFDTRTMRGYYCAEHRLVVERLMAGSGR